MDTGGSAAVNAALIGQGDMSGDGGNFARAVAAKVEPDVVTVHTLAAIRQTMTLEDQMFGRGSATAIRRDAGSGLIISPDGYILTNNHVVAGAQQVIVVISGKGCDARVVGTDALTDIAVVKVTPPAGTTLPVAQFGNSDAAQVGD